MLTKIARRLDFYHIILLIKNNVDCFGFIFCVLCFDNYDIYKCSIVDAV